MSLNLRLAILVLASLLALSGCSQQRLVEIWRLPKAMTAEQTLTRASSDWLAYSNDWPHPDKTMYLTPDRAVMLALARSWDVKKARMDLDLAKGQRLVSNYDRLPPLSLSLNSRREESETVTSTQVIWQDETTETGNLTLTLDLIRLATGALAYRQDINRAYIEQEMLRQAELELVSETLKRYWILALSQAPVDALKDTESDVSMLIDDVRTARREALVDPLSSLDEEERLFGLKKTSQRPAKDLDKARIELVTILRLPFGLQLELDDQAIISQGDRALRSDEIGVLARTALVNRSDLLVKDYQLRNAILEGQVDIWAILGSLNLTGTVSLLQTATLTREALAGAVGLTDDLTKLISARLLYKTAAQDEEAAVLERQILAASIISEVLLAAHAYNMALEDLEDDFETAGLKSERLRILSARLSEGQIRPSELPEAEVKAHQFQLDMAKKRVAIMEARLELASSLGLSAQMALAMPIDVIVEGGREVAQF